MTLPRLERFRLLHLVMGLTMTSANLPRSYRDRNRSQASLVLPSNDRDSLTTSDMQQGSDRFFGQFIQTASHPGPGGQSQPFPP